MADDVELELRRFRRATSSTPDDPRRRATWRALQEKTGSTPWRHRWVVGALTAAAAAVVVGVIIESTSGTRLDAATKARALDHAADLTQPAPTTDAATLPEAPREPSTVAALATPTTEVIEAPRSSPRIPSAPPAAPSVVERPEDRLAREAALIREAAEAIDARRWSDARTAIDAHRAAFERGSLAPERWVLDVRWTCAQQPARAPAVARAFSAAYPSQPKAQRLVVDDPCATVTNDRGRGQ